VIQRWGNKWSDAAEEWNFGPVKDGSYVSYADYAQEVQKLVALLREYREYLDAHGRTCNCDLCQRTDAVLKEHTHD
jgi:hypothetical protein